MKQLLLTGIALMVSGLTYAQILCLSSYEVDIYPCSHPNHGFIKTGFSTYHSKSIDSFIIDLNNKKFFFLVTKGGSQNRIYKLTKNNDLIIFATDYNSVRITRKTSGVYIIDIIYLDKNSWYMASYQCKINN